MLRLPCALKQKSLALALKPSCAWLCVLQEMEEEAAAKRARKAAEAAFLQLLKDNTPPDAASTSPREYATKQPCGSF